MLGLTVRFELRPGAGEAFDRLVAETAPLIASKEPGTLAYATHAVAGEPDARIFYELYRDREAFEEHERADHVRRFLAEREQYLAEPPRVELLDLKTAKSIPNAVSDSVRTPLTGVRAAVVTVRRRRDRLSETQIDEMLDVAISYCDRLNQALENPTAGDGTSTA